MRSCTALTGWQGRDPYEVALLAAAVNHPSVLKEKTIAIIVVKNVDRLSGRVGRQRDGGAVERAMSDVGCLEGGGWAWVVVGCYSGALQ